MENILLLTVISIIVVCNGNVIPDQGRNKVLLVAMSSLRHDYIHDRGDLEMFNKLKESGFYAKKMTVPFITSHYTTLWSAATGLYSEEHGIIDSRMYDPVTGLNFRNGKDNVRWYEKEPLWITAEREGVRTAVSSWPGSSLTFSGGVNATYAQGYVSKENRSGVAQRIATMARWMSESADLGMIYLPQPDGVAHKYGVDSQEVRNSVKENDDHLKFLFEELKRYGIFNQTNVIVFGDQGMTNHRRRDVVFLNECWNVGRTSLLGNLEWYTGQSFNAGMMEPRNGSLHAVYNSLVNCHPNVTVYKKEDIPERFHIKHHRRVSSLFLIADEGYRMQLAGLPFTGSFADQVVGTHGYDNQLSSMKSLMIANGPDFHNRTVEDFDLINIYPRVCEILGINCPLREPKEESTESPTTTAAITSTLETAESTTQSVSETSTEISAESTTQSVSETSTEISSDISAETSTENSKSTKEMPIDEPVSLEEPKKADMLDDGANKHDHGKQNIVDKKSSAHALMSSLTLLIACLLFVV